MPARSVRPRRTLSCLAPVVLVLAACVSADRGGADPPPPEPHAGAPTAAEGASPGAAAADPDTGPDPALAASGAHGVTRGGTFWVEWEPAPAPIPVNEPFELLVRVYADGERTELLDDVLVNVTGWMPGHGHGMHRKARVVSRREGVHRVRGMLFHMSGFWELNVDVTRQFYSERVTFPVELP